MQDNLAKKIKTTKRKRENTSVKKGIQPKFHHCHSPSPARETKKNSDI